MPKTRTSFKPGVSGNPKGRPKKGLSLAEKFRDALAEKANGDGDYTKLDQLIDKTVEMALAGDQSALEYTLARGYGKLIDRVESTNTNKIYDFSNLSLEERMKLLEQLRSVGTTVASDNPDTI
jgi:hypothetical protein